MLCAHIIVTLQAKENLITMYARTSRLIFCFLSAALLVVIAACQGGQTTNGNEHDSDSVKVPTFKELTLPDTMLTSAEVVTFVVDVADSSEHLLNDYDDAYAGTTNVCTFRGNALRNAQFGGKVEGEPDTVIVAWTFMTENSKVKTDIGVWGGGTGWTGQPLLLNDREVLVGSLCGKVYFIDFETGQKSREPYDAGNVVKGTMSLDPEWPNLYVGQGVSNHNAFGCEVFDLERNERTWFFNRDPKAWRSWGAYDSSPVVAGGYLFWPSENGSIYKYERARGELHRVATLRYRVNGAAPGIESSMCIYRNYGFIGDNHGNILAVNLNTMRPVWRYYNHDDSDGSIVCREENGTAYLYAGCEVDKQGMKGTCHIIKLRAVDGSLVWEQTFVCTRKDLGEKTLDGGMYSTPLLGTGNCDDLIFVNLCRNNAANTRGELVALHTADGSVAYTIPLKEWAWSSPVGFLNESNEMYIFTGDAGGNIYLIRGRDGEILYTQKLNALFESSPLVVGNAAIVGSRGNGIYKFIIQ